MSATTLGALGGRRWQLNLSDDRSQPQTIGEARDRLREIQEAGRNVIKIMTAEEALKAQRVVREAGRGARPK